LFQLCLDRLVFDTWILLGWMTYRELDPFLDSGNEGKDVVLGSRVYPFQDGQVGHHTPSVEVFEAVKG
jgi:hypothetical protein